MTAKKFLAALIISLAVLFAGGRPAPAQDLAACVRHAAAIDLAAKTEFQRGLRDLIVDKRPEFSALADINMELQILFAETRRTRMDYLLEHDPGRIDTANGLSRFSNFAWTDPDTANLVEKNSVYRDQEARLGVLRKQNDGHPDWPQLREYFRAELSRSAEFQALTTRLQDQQRDIETAIAQCRPG